MQAFTRFTRSLRNRRFRINERLRNRNNESPQLELTTTKSGMMYHNLPQTLKDGPSVIYTTPAKKRQRMRTKRYYRGSRVGRQGVPESFISISVPQSVAAPHLILVGSYLIISILEVAPSLDSLCYIFGDIICVNYMQLTSFVNSIDIQKHLCGFP